MSTPTEIYNLVKDPVLITIINQIVNIANPDKIILFGSRASGEYHSGSDYDICVLKNGIIAGAALDVFEHAPAINPKLLELDNVLLLPHMGSATLESRIDMGDKVLINIRTFVDGHKPPDRVIAKLI